MCVCAKGTDVGSTYNISFIKMEVQTLRLRWETHPPPLAEVPGLAVGVVSLVGHAPERWPLVHWHVPLLSLAVL